MTDDECAEFEKHRKKWVAALFQPNPFFFAVEQKRIMDSWLGGKPVGAP